MPELMKKRWIDFIGLALGISLIIAFSLSESVSAVRVGIETPRTRIEESTDVTLTAFVDIAGTERIPVSTLTVTIGGEPCRFDLTGKELSGSLCSQIEIDQNNKLDPSNGSRSGYDYWSGTNYTLGNGWGYGSSDDYSYLTFPFGELSYDVTWTADKVTKVTEYDVEISAEVNDTIVFEKKFNSLLTVTDSNQDEGNGNGNTDGNVTEEGEETGSGNAEEINPLVWRFYDFSANEYMVASFSDKNLGIESVEILAKKKLDEAQLTVTPYDNLPVLEDMDVLNAYDLEFTDKNIKSATVRFTVLSKQIENEDGNIDDFMVMQKKNNKWKNVNAEIISEKRGIVTLEMTVKKLGEFAIGFQKSKKTKTVRNVSSARKRTAPPKAPVVNNKKNQGIPLSSSILGSLAIGIIATIFIAHKRGFLKKDKLGEPVKNHS